MFFHGHPGTRAGEACALETWVPLSLGYYQFMTVRLQVEDCVEQRRCSYLLFRWKKQSLGRGAYIKGFVILHSHSTYLFKIPDIVVFTSVSLIFVFFCF
jgi:hypothetical protein